MYFIEDHYYTINKPALKALGIWPSDRSRIVILQRVLIFLVLGSHMLVQVTGLRHRQDTNESEIALCRYSITFCAHMSRDIETFFVQHWYTKENGNIFSSESTNYIEVA